MRGGLVVPFPVEIRLVSEPAREVVEELTSGFDCCWRLTRRPQALGLGAILPRAFFSCKAHTGERCITRARALAPRYRGVNEAICVGLGLTQFRSTALRTSIAGYGV